MVLGVLSCETGFYEGYCYWRRSREAGRDRVSLYLFPYHPGLLLSFTAYLTDFTQLIENRRSIDRVHGLIAVTIQEREVRAPLH